MDNVLIVTNAMDRVRDLSAGLSRIGFSCTCCVCADDLLEQDRKQSFGVILMDMSTFSQQGDSAWKWFRKLKLRRLLPIIALISMPTLHSITGEHGFDDFIMKPWNLEELATRIRRLIIKHSNLNQDKVINVGDLTIDPARCDVELGGRLLALTYKEYEMLKLLASNKGKVFTREALLNEIWGYDYYGGDRTVDVHIRRLRSKIEDPTHVFIETVRNIGYRFKDNASPARHVTKS